MLTNLGDWAAARSARETARVTSALAPSVTPPLAPHAHSITVITECPDRTWTVVARRLGAGRLGSGQSSGQGSAQSTVLGWIYRDGPVGGSTDGFEVTIAGDLIRVVRVPSLEAAVDVLVMDATAAAPGISPVRWVG